MALSEVLDRGGLVGGCRPRRSDELEATGGRGARHLDAHDHGRGRGGLRQILGRSQPAPFRSSVRGRHHGRTTRGPGRADDCSVQRPRRDGAAGTRQRLPPSGVGLPGSGLHRRHRHRRGGGHRGPRRQADREATLWLASWRLPNARPYRGRRPTEEVPISSAGTQRGQDAARMSAMVWASPPGFWSAIM